MTKVIYVIIGLALIISIGLLFWYFTTLDTKVENLPDEIGVPSDIADQVLKPQLPNPASVYCVDDMKGELKIIETSEGQVGVCHLPDGRWCEEWKLFRTNTCVPLEDVSDAELNGKG